MQVGRINGCTRVIGKSQGFIGLPIRDELIHAKVTGENTPCMTTAWFPTPMELAALNGGAPVYVQLIGTNHPPIMVEVGELPD